MTYIPLASTDNGSTSRGTINTNFAALDVTDALKVEFSGTVPADGDLTVFSGATGKVIKKKVFTASQTLESDSNGQPVSAAKGTGYNLNLGTTAGTVLEGSNDALYMKLAGTQTVTGDKTFSGALTIPSATIATTQSVGDNTTKVATTAFVTAAAGIYKNGTTTKNLADATAAVTTIAHGVGIIPKYARITAFFAPSNALPTTIATQVYNGTTASVVGSSGTSTTRIDADSSGTMRVSDSSDSAATQTATITMDATNIYLTWSKSGSPTGTVRILWEANT